MVHWMGPSPGKTYTARGSERAVDVEEADGVLEGTLVERRIGGC